MPVTTGLVLAGGAAFGSAAGAAMHRWPAGGTLVEPRRSKCDACGAELRIADLVPVVSWALLRGACRDCGARIDPRLPLLELAAGLLAVAVVRSHGPTLTAAVLAVGCIAVLVAALIDVEHLIIPDRLTLLLAALALLALPVVAGRERATIAAAWAIGVPLALRVMAFAADRAGRSRPLGGGDIKLLVGVLAMSGVASQGPPAVLLGAVVVGGSVAAAGLLTGRLTRRSRVPFAPAIAVPFLVVAVAPERAVDIVTILGGHAWSV